MGMDPLLIVLIIALLPALILTLFRANAATAFLALCLGSVLGQFVASDVIDALQGYIAPNSSLSESVVRLILLWLPVALTSIFMSHTISKGQRLINLLPALMVGLVGVLLSVPYLTPDVRAAVDLHSVWHFVEQYQAIIVASATLLSLFMLRMRSSGEEGKRSRHH